MGFDDLSSLLVMEEACGPTPKDFFDTNQDHEMVYAVIEYLIKQGVLDLARHWRWKSKSLKYAVDRDNLNDVMSIVALAPSAAAVVALAPTSLVPEALSLSARSGKLNILEALVDEYPDVEVTRLLTATVESNDPDVEFVLSLDQDDEHVDAAVRAALNSNKSLSLGILLDHSDMTLEDAFEVLETTAQLWYQGSRRRTRATCSGVHRSQHQDQPGSEQCHIRPWWSLEAHRDEGHPAAHRR